MGFWLDDTGVNAPAPRAISNMIQTLRRLYEQTRHLTVTQWQGRVAQYLKHWLQWAGTGAGIAAAPVNTPVTVPLTT